MPRTAGETFLSATAMRTARKFSSWPSMRSTESNSPEPRSRWLRMPDAAKAPRGRVATPISAKAADEPRTTAARRDANATPWVSGAMRGAPSNANTLAQLRRVMTVRISVAPFKSREKPARLSSSVAARPVAVGPPGHWQVHEGSTSHGATGAPAQHTAAPLGISIGRARLRRPYRSCASRTAAVSAVGGAGAFDSEGKLTSRTGHCRAFRAPSTRQTSGTQHLARWPPKRSLPNARPHLLSRCRLAGCGRGAWRSRARIAELRAARRESLPHRWNHQIGRGHAATRFVATAESLPRPRKANVKGAERCAAPL